LTGALAGDIITVILKWLILDNKLSTLSTLPGKKLNGGWRGKRGRNPLGGGFYFGLASFVLFGLLFFSSSGLAQLSGPQSNDVVFLNSFANTSEIDNGDLFFSQSRAYAPETPDLKIIEDAFVYGVSTPQVFNTQTLGSIMGGAEQPQERKEIVNYAVQQGDTIATVAQTFGVSVNTVLWVNNLSKTSTLKEGQNLVILPVSGALHVVKSGDTISQIGSTYKSASGEIIAFNGLGGEGDIFIGDVLIVPGGSMPVKLPSVTVAPLADSFFIYPAEGHVSQRLHYYNGVDVANKCGTPIYAAAAGTVQRAVGNGKWNAGKGNHITILHSGEISTYYGHLMTLFVAPGEKVNVGDRIGLMGSTGQATGCHVHFQVMGAKNPLSRFPVGTTLQYK